jgi:hypothetical protein
MNERIRQLKEQSMEWVPNMADPDTKIRLLNAEKFAELIVRECADACYKHKDVESFGIYPVRVAMVTKACSDNIKEHFGVEE